MRWQRITILVALLGAWVAFGSWQYRAYIQQRNLIRESLQQQADSIMNALLGGVQSHRRLGRYFVDQLQGMLDELIQSDDVLAATVTLEGGELLISAGDVKGVPSTTGREAGQYWEETCYQLVRSFQLQPASGGPGRAESGRGGRGRGPGALMWSEAKEAEGPFLEGGRFLASLTLERRRTDSLIHQSARTYTLVFVASGAVVLCLGLIWSATMRLSDARGRAEVYQSQMQHLRELNQAAAGLAHETRNPLGLVRGWTQRVAQADLDGDERQRYVQAVIEECDRIAARINQFLAFARPTEMQTTAVDIQQTIDQLAVILQPDLELKEVRLKPRVVAESRWLEADAEQLRQILFNLLQNAIQASPSNSEIELEVRSGPQGLHQLRVSDSGPGVPPAEVQSLFTPYFTTRRDGTGLGLAIVRRIAIEHGWQCEYQPRRGGAHTSWSREFMPHNRRTVLVVDDEVDQRELLGGFVKTLGYQVREASSGEEALRCIAEADVDMVLLDVRLGGMSGIATLAEIRKRSDTLPVMLVTAHADLKQAVSAVKGGADDYLSKPVDLDELRVALLDAMGDSEPSSKSQVPHPPLPADVVCTANRCAVCLTRWPWWLPPRRRCWSAVKRESARRSWLGCCMRGVRVATVRWSPQTVRRFPRR